MQTQRVNITLPVDLARELRRNIPEGARSKFIAKAVKDKLSRKKLKLSLKRSLKVNAEFYKKVAEEWRATEVEGWPK